MEIVSFLDRVSKRIQKDHPHTLQEVVVVLPNKRAKVFLLESLRKVYDHTFFAPKIISIEELIQDISGIRTIDPVELLFEFYEVYKTITPKEKVQDFDYFANWAKMLLQDFNEIDRYLLNPDHVFSYLKDIEDIKHWSLDLEKRTELIANYLEFWEVMPDYYRGLYQYLKEKGVGYQGLVYREAVGQHKAYLKSNPRHYYCVGFNALNAAEEVIFQSFLELEKATVLWDIDAVFMSDPYHDAAYFLRRIKRKWRHYKTHPFEWVSDVYKESKNIQVIQTPKSVGQAKIVGKLIEGLIDEGVPLERTAVVLGEENLLLPILHALPEEVNSLNITMGYDGKSNPVQVLLNKMFKMHLNALKRNPDSYVFYYKDVLELLNHPLVGSYVEADSIVSHIHKYNWSFFTWEKLHALTGNSDALLNLLFEKWDRNAVDILYTLQSILIEIREAVGDRTKEDKLTRTFLYAAYNLLNKLISYCEKYEVIAQPDILYAIYKQTLDLSQVSFEGEPLEGLQLMGVLESRVLDFENVIITSVNEGKFPAGKTQNSFIPYDVKRELGLPTYKEKDAIYSFHFYHLLMRAKKVYLLYNSTSEGLDAGEKSRFITQIEVEKQPQHKLEHYTYSAFLPEKAYEPLQIFKSVSLQEKIKEIATGSGFSPSALASYLRDPIRFYTQYILKINELEEVEESVTLNTLGIIIHGALECLYTPYVGRLLTVEDVKSMRRKADSEVDRQFELVYSDAKERLGKNLLAFEVAKRHVFLFLQQELEALQKGDEVVIRALETRLSFVLEDERLPYPIKLKGFVDRIESRNEVLRIIDYKTGRVDLSDVRLTAWEGFAMELKNDKVIQLLSYALMYSQEYKEESVEAAIYSFKNRRAGYLPFGIKEGKGYVNTIDASVLTSFKEELVGLLLQIISAEEPFVEEL